MKKVSGFNLPVVLFLVAMVASSLLNAQDYQRKINWQATAKTFSPIDDKTIAQPTFQGAVHSEKEDLLPYYSEVLPTGMSGTISAQLINIVYSTAQNVDANSKKYIPAAIQVAASSSERRKKIGAYVSFLPFRKNPATGIIEKVESFTLRLSITPKLQSKALHTYAANSVLSSGTWYKVGVNSEGIYKLDYNFIKSSLGVNPGSIDVSRLAIFGNGGGMVPDQNSVARPDDLLENPTMFVDNNSNGKFDQDDYLLFYAQMPDAWQFNASTQTFNHIKNLYTNKTFYFITTDQGTGKRISPAASSGSNTITINTFDDRVFHDSDEVNLLLSGKTWLGDKMTSYSSSRNFSYNFPNLVTSSPVKFLSLIAAFSPAGSTTSVSVNGAQLLSQSVPLINISNPFPFASIRSLATDSFTATSEQLNISYSLTVNPPDDGTAFSYIDYFEINLKRALTMNGNVMPFRSIASVGNGNISKFVLNNSTSSTLVWDVTNISSIQQMPSSLNGSELSFTTSTSTLKEFIAFNSNATFSTPEFVERVENQNLHATGQPAMVIVAFDDFVAPSNDLADFHRVNDNITVSVVKTSQIFNEFGSGRPDISAIRDFMKMLYDRAGNDTPSIPKYLLLMGDGSFDAKNRIANAQNYISTYQSNESNDPTQTYVSDDFFSLLGDNEGGDITDASQLPDIGVGRLPVESETEAWGVVAKIKNYKKPTAASLSSCVTTNSDNSWRNNLTFICDDEDGDIHLDATEQLDEATRASQPVYNYDKIYCDAFKQVSTPAGDRYPDVNTAILNKINTGTLIINWVGHGGPTNWAQERIFNMSDIVQLQNQDRLPLFITATCDFSAYDLDSRTAGESLIVNPKGGGIASVTTVRLVYSNANQALDAGIFQYLFQRSNYIGGYLRLGDIIMLSKDNVNTDITNTRKFCLLGDPALQLNYPQYNVVTSTVDNKPVSAPHDTLKALSTITIKGEVHDNNGNKMTSFNGIIYPVVYDKISTLQTLGNDPTSPIRQFLLYKNILFKGKASVTAGNFTFTFIVPKDINYQFGNGRISYYTDNGSYIDAHGYSNDIVVGGSADSAAVDKTGPQINIYMNDLNFAFGGTTNTSPVLLVNLQDPSGINTTANGVGHDLTAVLDNSQNKIVLNDYYQSDQDNFKKGTVKYPLSGLADGRHSLTITAWDVYNNSSEAYIEFIVTSNAKLALNHVYNYPNPFTTHTQFMFEHNKPCDDLDVSIQIYSVGGKLVKSIVSHQMDCTGYRVDNIEWDGLDDYGSPIGKGVYVYKLTVRDSEGDVAHKFEKLVVLR